MNWASSESDCEKKVISRAASSVEDSGENGATNRTGADGNGDADDDDDDDDDDDEED